MNKATLLLGGNVGDRVALLENARRNIIESIGRIHASSSLYESEAWGFDCKESFLNQVVIVETQLNPRELLKKLKSIEKAHGRVLNSSKEYTSRTLDIDILFFNDDKINEVDLIIPHPRIQERKFALMPLDELERSFVHPTLNKTIEKLFHECDDQLDVKKYSITS